MPPLSLDDSHLGPWMMLLSSFGALPKGSLSFLSAVGPPKRGPEANSPWSHTTREWLSGWVLGSLLGSVDSQESGRRSNSSASRTFARCGGEAWSSWSEGVAAHAEQSLLVGGSSLQ